MKSFQSSPRSPRFLGAPLIFLVFLFFALRLTLLLTSGRILFWFEEFYRGAAALCLMKNVPIPLWDLQADSYDGGSLIVSILAVPFFKLIGSNLFALKMAPLFFSLTCFVTLYFWMNRFFGKRSALFVSFFYLFAPPVFLKHSLATIGSHTESILFALLCYHLFYCYWDSEPRSSRYLFWAGLVGGLGCWFTSMTGLALVALVISWAILDRGKICWRSLALFLTAFFAGLAPWFFYNVGHQHVSLNFLYHSFNPPHLTLLQQLLLIPKRLIQILLVSFPNSGCFPDSFISGVLLSRVYAGLLIISMVPWGVASARSHNNHQKCFLWNRWIPIYMYLAVYLGAFAVSQYETLLPATDRWILFRYFTSFYFFTWVLMASYLSEEVRFSNLRRVLTYLVILIGIFGYSRLLFQDQPGAILHYKGYSYLELGKKLGKESESLADLSKKYFKIASSISDSKDRQALARGLFSAVKSMESSDLFAEGLKFYKSLPKDDRTFFLESWGGVAGNWMAEHGAFESKVDDQIAPEDREFFYRGIAGSSLFAWGGQNVETYISVLRAGNVKWRPWLFLYFGRHFFSLAGDYLNHDETRIKQTLSQILILLNEGEKSDFVKGLGQGFSWDDFTEGEKPMFLAQHLPELLPENLWKDFYYGFGWRFRLIRISGWELFQNETLQLPMEYQKGVRKGFWDAHHLYRIQDTLPPPWGEA